MGTVFGDKLKELRKETGMNTVEVSEKLKSRGFDVAGKTLSGYENGIRMPNADVFMALMSIYECKNILEIFSFVSADYSVPTDDEWKIIESYRKLDDYGKETINIALERETNRVRQLMDKSSEIISLNAALHKTPQTMRIYTYLRKIACAGTGFYFDDIPTETIAVPYMEGADFIISVNGDSMEPDYHDGEYLYVKKTDHINYGEVGIFTVNNECFLKEFGEEGLISRNKNYKDIPGNEDVRLIGKVIGKVQGDE